MIRLLAPLLLIIQITFAIHVFKSGRDQKWIWIIMFAPVLGCLAYYVVEIFPNSREERKVREGIRDIAKSLNPDGELKRRAAELQVSDTVENKTALAEECLAKGMFDEAITLYLSAMSGPFAADPKLLFGLGRAYFYNGNFTDAKCLFERLHGERGDFHRNEVELLLARCYESLGNAAEAERLYEKLKDHYVGFEAKYRYAVMLKRSGHPAQANELFDAVITAGQRNKNMLADEREWLKLATHERNANAA